MKYISILLIILTLISGTDAQPAKEHGRLHVQGTQLTDEHGKPVVLRGVSFGWLNFWPRFYNAGAVNWLSKDWHADVVRAAMGIETHNGFKENPEFSRKLMYAVIDQAIRDGIYVIIDWHSHNINLEEAKAFFTEVSKRYGKQKNIIYELINEPDQESWEEVQAYSSAIIPLIRANDPNNIILVGCPHWDQDIHLVAAHPLTGFSNIMYTVHFYAATHKQELRDRCTAALQQGIPIFISECAGMEASGDGPINNTEWENWLLFMKKNNLSWAAWSLSDKNETCSMLLPSADSSGHWKDGDIKEWGTIVRLQLLHK